MTATTWHPRGALDTRGRWWSALTVPEQHEIRQEHPHWYETQLEELRWERRPTPPAGVRDVLRELGLLDCDDVAGARDLLRGYGVPLTAPGVAPVGD